jgi:non-specific serine/threonine protein kinase/serine/threonine-protein kinase
MTPERWQQVRALYEQASALTVEKRSPLLEKVGVTDPDLRYEVESLLVCEDRAQSSFLQVPAADLLQPEMEEAGLGSRVGRRIGVYQIIEEIGRGGMGEVYRAARVDGQYEKEVAIKLVRGGFDSASVLQRFRQERQILASLDHPNIARLLDGGTTDDGIPYLVMELIEGAPIDQYCADLKLSVNDRLQLFRKVCAAVQYAHQRLVIYRDLKPGNILVTKEGVPKLLDFGIAKLLDTSIAPEATLFGAMTPEYASPEQVRGEPITTASDVYSLGVVLYRILTGASPYGVVAQSAPKLAQAITDTDPERPSSMVTRQPAMPSTGLSVADRAARKRVRRQLSGDIDTIVLKALRKESVRRYVSVDKFEEDIRRHLEGLPVLAVPDSLPYRLNKFIQRNKVGVSAAALVLIAILGGASISLRQASIAQQQRRRAEKRFEDVRKLANSLIFEIHDSIEALPGATAARKLIVQRSQEYLDSLAQESSGDASLQRELASAYERLGNVQGDMYGSSLGDAKGAVESLRKATQIREAVVTANPGNVEDLIALTRVYHETGRVQWFALGGTQEGLQSLQDAVATGESAVRLNPQNVRAIETLARAYQYLGDIQGGSGLRGGTAALRQALENHRKAIALLQEVADAAPSDPEKCYLLSRVTIALGDDYVRFGDAEQALRSYRQAEEMLKPVAEKENNTVYRRGYAVCHTRMGDALLMIGRPSEALTHYKKERQLLEPLAIADPRDMTVQSTFVTSEGDIGHAMVEAGQLEEGTVTLRRALARTVAHAKVVGDSYARTLLASTTALLGEALERRGNNREAQAYYAQALALYMATTAADAADEEDEVNMIIMRNHLGSSWRKSGNLSAAQQNYRGALAQEDAVAASGSENVELLYASADTYAGMGDTLAALAKRATTREERSRAWGEARYWYTKSLDAWQRIPNPGPLSPNLFRVTRPREVASRLAECETTLARLKAQAPPE